MSTSVKSKSLDQEIIDLGGEENPEDGSSLADVEVDQRFYLLVCGGRDFRDGKTVRRIMEQYLTTHGKALRIIEGGAEGADRHAAKWAKARGVPSRRFDAPWAEHGKVAGRVRNEQMAAYLLWCQSMGHTAHVVAFPGHAGTKHMMEHAKSVGLSVGVIRQQQS